MNSAPMKAYEGGKSDKKKDKRGPKEGSPAEETGDVAMMVGGKGVTHAKLKKMARQYLKAHGG